MPDTTIERVRVRMFRQGLGDCHLISFFTRDNTPFHMLIDCGTLGATTTGVKIADVVAHIARETDEHLHLLIATHEHHDHLSGFNSARAAFDRFQVDQVWAAWTEDPADPLARDLAEHADDLLNTLRLAADALDANSARLRTERKALRELGAEIRDLLSFSGELPADDAPLAADFSKTVNEAMNYVTARSNTPPARQPPAFLTPGQVLELSALPGVRFYVLGPPRDALQLNNMGTHSSPELYHLARRQSADLAQRIRFNGSDKSFDSYREGLSASEREQFQADLPFDPVFRIELDNRSARKQFLKSYDRPDQAWRRIDCDWLAAAEDLALQHDNMINNTSLVLAIELIADGRVLLFPADAQLGSWLSWQDLEFQITENDCVTRTVRANDLLARTVLYKVAHHSSHNATINTNGLEAMTRQDLAAFIPVDRKVALKKGGSWQMPARALYKRLLEKTNGRVLRSDIGWSTFREPNPAISKADWDPAWDAARNAENISVEDLYIEYRLG